MIQDAGSVDPASCRAFMIGGDLIPVFPSSCVASVDDLLANIRSALARGLPEAKMCKAHGHTLSIAGGGPSLADTYQDLTGYVGAVNGSARKLVNLGVVPNACLLLDPSPELADQLEPRTDVRWFVASQCHPGVFERLSGCHVELWHASGVMGMSEVIGDRMSVGGGCSVTLRWLTMGYVLGFRKFALHGMDSSYRGNEHHAYPVPTEDGLPTLEVHGFTTRTDLLAQFNDFFAMLKRLQLPDIDPVKIDVLGDGLLQRHWKQYQERHPGAFQ